MDLVLSWCDLVMVPDWSWNGTGLVLWCGESDIWSSVYCSVLLSSCSMLECWPQLLLNNWWVFSEWGWGGCCWWKFKDAVFQHFGIFANSGENAAVNVLNWVADMFNHHYIFFYCTNVLSLTASLLRHNLDHGLWTSWRWAYSRWMTPSARWYYQAGH